MHQTISGRLQKLMDNIAVDFSVEKLSKSPARFNLQKLDWFNREFLKMMSLSEFAFRACDNRLRQKFPEKKLRIGDYVMFVDVNKQKVFANLAFTPTGQDGQFYLIGGGRENGLFGPENLEREILEEVPNRLNFDLTKFLPVCSFSILSDQPFIRENTTYDGKEFHIYFYEISENQISPFTLTTVEDGKKWDFTWFNLSEVIATNQYLTFPIWKKFCEENQIPCFKPTEAIKEQYLAWLLDKNRVTVLSELGFESNSILNWQKPNKADVKWKKSTPDESLQNLVEIGQFILHQFETNAELKNQQKRLWDGVFQTQVEEEFSKTVLIWENLIKSWLQENNKKTGDFLWPLRVTLSGKKQSPSPFELLSVLHAGSVKKRIEEVKNLN